jgi:oligosaccharide repeat unit polymerase
MPNHTDKNPGYLHIMFIVVMMILACATAFASCQNYIDRLWAFTAYYIVTASILLKIYHRKNSIDLLSPVIGLVVLLFLYSIASAIDVETNGTTYYGDHISSSSLLQYYLICLTGLVGLVLGMIMVNPKAKEKGKIRLPNNKTVRCCIFGLAIVLGSVCAVNIFGFFDVTNIKSYTDMALVSRLERMQVSSAGVKEVFTQSIPVAFILASAILLLFSKKVLLKVIGFAIVADYLLVNTLSGWRGLVMGAAVMLLSYYHYKIKPIKVKNGVILAIVTYLFMNVMPVVRSSSNPVEMLSLLLDYSQKYGTKFLQISSSGELVVGENLLRLIEGINQGETHFTYGWSIITEFMVFLPRIFFHERPLPLNEMFVEVFYPGVRDQGGGYGFFFLQEGYWAFGTFGVFLFMLFYGWITQKVYLMFRKHFASDLIALSYGGVYYALVVSSVRNGVLGAIKAALMNCLPFVILFVLLRLLEKTKPAVHENAQRQLAASTEGA